jgi:pseudaminic acid biosynthesis-associated methylase
MAKNDQLKFWQGQFGDSYADRNVADAETLDQRKAMWTRMLAAMSPSPESILEVGANVGLNLRALSALLPAELNAVEPNAKARVILGESGALPAERIHSASSTGLPLDDGSVELTFTSGVLIHIAPDDLLPSCREMHRVSSRYIACAEYFNPTPVEIEYRGHSGVLFKRDFGAFWLDNFADLELVDYGFFWKRATGLDDLTWWVFRKR